MMGGGRHSIESGRGGGFSMGAPKERFVAAAPTQAVRQQPKKADSVITKAFTAVKEFFNPPAVNERKESGAVIALYVFEDKLKHLVDVLDKDGLE